jgi:F0F1-type ATP synthase assembly protein I
MNEAQKLREQRSSQIYDSFKSARMKFELQAEESRKQMEDAWKEQGMYLLCEFIDAILGLNGFICTTCSNFHSRKESKRS